MKARVLDFFYTVKSKILNFFTSTTYRPLILRMGDRLKISPFIVFIILFSLSFLFKNIPGINLTNSLGISFVIPYLIWFSRKVEYYLKKIKPSLNIDEHQYQDLFIQSGHYRFYRFLLVSLLAPLLVFVVNYNSPNGHFQVDGQFYFLGLGLSKWFAILTGMLLLQLNYITITEVLRFNKIERNFAFVDLLDIHKLDPFSQMGIAAAMSIIGLYTVFPFSIWKEPELMTSLFSTLIISGPILLFLLFVPFYGIYNDISKKLRNEKLLIRKAMDNHEPSLAQLAITNKQPKISVMELIAYRKYIYELSPIPIAQNNLVRLMGSFILLISSWIFPYYYEAILNAF